MDKKDDDNDNNPPENLESFYSPKGYIQVLKSDYESDLKEIKYTKNSKSEGTIDKSLLKKNITIYLKTFYGPRTKYKLEVNITETLSELVIHMISIEANNNTVEKAFDINKQYRLIAPCSTLKLLCLYKTYVEEDIKDGQIILLLPIAKYKFSRILHGSHCYLENKKTTIIKKDVDDLEFAMLDLPIFYGKRYIEFTLQAEPIEQNIIIGITKRRTNFKNFYDSKDFYGYILSDKKKVYNENNKKITLDYGKNCVIGDKIGMLIDLNKKERELSFYLNGGPLGIAFKDLPMDLFFPCVCLGFPGTKIKIEEYSDFPQN